MSKTNSKMWPIEEEFSNRDKPIELKHEIERLKTKRDQMKKDNFRLKTEAESLQKVLSTKTAELETVNSTLNQSQENIWRSRDTFCDKADVFLNEFGILSENWTSRRNEITSINMIQAIKRKENLRQEIIYFEEEISKETIALKNSEEMLVQAEKETEELNTELKLLLKRRDELEKQPEGLNYTNMLHSIDLTRKRCQELEGLLDVQTVVVSCEEVSTTVRDVPTDSKAMFQLMDLSQLRPRSKRPLPKPVNGIAQSATNLSPAGGASVDHRGTITDIVNSVLLRGQQQN